MADDGVTRASVNPDSDAPAEDPAVDAPEQPEGQEGDQDRPEWLPEKFDNPEDLAKSYMELERKLGSGEETGEEGPQDQPEDDSEDLDPEDLKIQQEEIEEESGLNFDMVTQELAENGELSDETYEKFEDAGIPREILDTHVAGLEALAREQTRRMAEVAGGTENLQAVLEWAGRNLSDEQINSYNRALEENRTGDAELALRGIVQQYQESEGVEPSLVRGEGSPRSTGVQPFKSSTEVTEAMSDPRYKTDPAYRQKVADRLAVSEVF